ncbi:hypothetical protein PYCC9005_003470 [Savitreella phatthalungensis]
MPADGPPAIVDRDVAVEVDVVMVELECGTDRRFLAGSELVIDCVAAAAGPDALAVAGGDMDADADADADAEIETEAEAEVDESGGEVDTRTEPGDDAEDRFGLVLSCGVAISIV